MLSVDLETVLPLVAPDRDAFFSGAAATGLRTGAALFAAGLTAVLAAGFVDAADFVGVFAVFAALVRVAAGVFGFATFAATAGFGDFTALLAGAFFAAVEVLPAAFSGLATLPASDFTEVLAGAFLAAGGLVRALLAVVFLALFAAFVTVAFIVPRP
ncbi:hypothetical protein [Oxalicibacterium solurbis]|uniref:hypothetical protein n=1 Tax=Oxalicibacterium solurbis TaxID=69280 RepID=UPI001669F909|nr:hypothetical protein [Oxalicibacterium solurbis]